MRLFNQLKLNRVKENKNIESASSEKHIVTPQNDPDQSVYTCHGNRNERPLYSKPSDSFKTKNLREYNEQFRAFTQKYPASLWSCVYVCVVLKRRVLLAISGCLFFGIIAVLMGCVALRVFRKPGIAFLSFWPCANEVKVIAPTLQLHLVVETHKT